MKRHKEVSIENPGHNLEAITIENGDNSGVRILPYHKLEGGTHKMVSCAGMAQRIPEGARELIESTSGNTGYASAFYARLIGLPIRVYIPEGMAPTKLRMIESLGATIIQTPRSEYTTGARNRAQADFDEDSEAKWFFNQASNPGNWGAHEEIAYKFGEVDQLTMIGGTCGAIAGLGKGLKAARPTVVTQIDLDAGPHFHNKKHGKSSAWQEHRIVGAAPSKMSAIGESFYQMMDRTAVISASDCEQLFQAALVANLDAGKSSIVNLAVAARIAKRFQCLVGTATFDNINRYSEADDRPTESFSFTLDNIANFLRSEIVRTFSIAMEDLHRDQTYQI